MGILPWDSALDLIKTGIDKIWPDKTEADKAKAALVQAELAGQLEEVKAQWNNAKAQIEVNAEEAKSSSVFVAGWRPFIGWVCGSAFAWAFVLSPIILTGSAMLGHPISPSTLPKIDFDQLQPVLYGMLGLAGLRSFEKTKGVASKK